MTTQQTTDLYKQYVMSTYAQSLVLVKGQGARVWDADGNVYLDFLGGVAVLSLGHCHPKLVQALHAQAQTVMHVSNLFYNENQPRLAQKLIEKFGPGKCFFCNSGAEANEGLIKLARLWGNKQGKNEIVSMVNSFHGRTLAAITATGQTKYQKGFEPLPTGFSYATFNDIESVQSVVTDKTAAIFVEAIQGEGGVIPATPEFIAGLRKLCDDKNILLIFDEVQTGVGRTGRWFGFQHFGIQPDAISLAKGLGGGFPVGAIVAGPKIAEVFQAGHHASTFGGTPLACAAALTVLQVVEDEGLRQNAAAMGERFRAGLAAIANKYAWAGAGVRGMGLMLGLVLDRPAKDLEIQMRKHGLLAIATAEKTVRFLPPLNVHEAEIDEALEIVAKSCAAFDASLASAAKP
ncbi:MAG TPA: aspartate aminotransferase family protein [Kiritimatiellia bacterium]|jgi:predicted acetylornithine/succinylornithine family transaminase